MQNKILWKSLKYILDITIVKHFEKNIEVFNTAKESPNTFGHKHPKLLESGTRNLNVNYEKTL